MCNRAIRSARRSATPFGSPLDQSATPKHPRAIGRLQGNIMSTPVRHAIIDAPQRSREQTP